MERTLIVLQGRTNSGKSTTLRRAYQLLKDTGAKVLQSGMRRRFAKDIRCGILEIDGVLVGFLSIAEPAGKLSDKLEKLVEEDCSVIVCAARSTGRTITAVKNLVEAHGYNFVPIPKGRDEEADQDRANRKKAREIVGAVKNAVEKALLIEA